MNTDELIERIHNENATLRRTEHRAPQRPSIRISSRKSPLRAPLELVSAAAAAILLIVLLPRERAVIGSSGNTTYASAGIYCNSQCNPDDVLALIDNNINHIKTIKAL